MLISTAFVKTTLRCDFHPWLKTAAISLCTALLLASCSNRTELDSSVRSLTFKTLSGAQLVLQDSTGPTLVNFWSTSCTVCIREMPDMAKLYNDYSPKGFELIAVAMPYDPPNTVLELVNAKNLPFPVALDLKGEALAAFESVKGTPTSFLLDAQGKLVERYVGAIEPDKLRNQLNKLLGVS